MEVQLVLQRGRSQAGLVDFATLDADPGFDQVVGEDVACGEEVMIFLKGIHGLCQGARNLLDACVLFRRQLVQILVDRLRRSMWFRMPSRPAISCAEKARNEVAGRIRSTELDALCSRGGAGQRDTDGGGAVACGVHQG